MNAHAHVHIIMTAGGVSSDKTKWINIDSSHPAMQNASLADQFRTRFLRRTAGSWFREKPDASELFARSSGFLQTQLHAPINAPGLASFEQMVEFVDPAFTKTPLPPGKSRRVMTNTEKALYDKLGDRQWIASCQPTPPEYDGPERVINYLSNYVQGNVISAGWDINKGKGQAMHYFAERKRTGYALLRERCLLRSLECSAQESLDITRFD